MSDFTSAVKREWQEFALPMTRYGAVLSGLTGIWEDYRAWKLSGMQETARKYLCLVYGEEKKIGAMTDDECMAYDQSLRDGGRCLASEALQPVQTATVVRVREGKVSIRDGPFAETKEVLAGFYLIDAADLNDAIQVASQMPPARVGSIEVRPVRELISTSGERRRI